MRVIEALEGTFTGLQLAHDFLLYKYSLHDPQDCLFYWTSDLEVNRQVFANPLDMVFSIPSDIPTISSNSKHFHFVLYLLDRYPLVGPTLRMLFLSEVATHCRSYGKDCEISTSGEVLVNEHQLTSSLCGYYPDRTVVWCSVNLDVLNTCGINLVDTRRRLVSTLGGLLGSVYREEYLTVLRH